MAAVRLAKMTRGLAAVMTVGAACALAQPAFAQSNFVPTAPPTNASDPAESHSIGHSAAGRLLNGVPLPDSDAIQTYERRARYGTAELVTLLQTAARTVRGAHPGTPPLTVGDLSRRRGGAFPPHRSHRNGRDVDVGFYYLDAEGAPMTAPRFLGIRRDGRCTTPGGVPCGLDRARTWTLLASMLPTDTQVQYMLMAPHIRTMLLEQAERSHADEGLVRRFRMVSLPTAQSRSHVNHVHVRLYCAEDDRPRCVDPPPHLPWYRFPADTDPALVAAAATRVERRLQEDGALEARARAQRARFTERAARLRAQDEAQRAARAARRERVRARAAAAAEVEARARAERRARGRARAERAQAVVDEAARVRAERRARARARVEAQQAEETAARDARRARARERAAREAAEARAERAARRARAQARAAAMEAAEEERLRQRRARRSR
ncbi:MAG: penicillin-insensitive murein endopeptidase [Sandaracinaceae bacterium]